ncbi:MAG: hypothetical protein ACP5NF_06905 [Thermoanaerobaculum sp.]
MWGALVLMLAAAVAAPPPQGLEHRLWLLRKVRPGVVEEARRVGVDAVVLPVGEVTVRGREATVTLAPLPAPSDLQGLPLWAALWVRGEGATKEAALALWNQLGPAVRGLGVPVRGLVLVATSLPPGCATVAAELAKLSKLPVELGAPVGDLLRETQNGKPQGITLVAFALGNLGVLGFPEVTPQDAADLLASLDEQGLPFRGALVVGGGIEPPPPEGANPWELVSQLDYQPTASGDVLVATRPLSGGGWSLSAGARLTVRAYDAARLERDLGVLLRPVRRSLIGWDSVGELPPAPALGFTWEAFVGFFSGQPPWPQPAVRGEWVSPTTVKLTVENPTPFASAFATTGNFLDVSFAGTEVKDVTLAVASGADFGQKGRGFVRTPRGAATTVRLYLKVVPPNASLEMATVSFISRPKELSASFTLRLGDGRQLELPVVMSLPR